MDVDGERDVAHVRGHALGVRDEVGLGEHDDRLRARAPGQGQHALDPAEVRVGVQVLHDQDDVDVRRERLHMAGRAGRVADQSGPALVDQDRVVVVDVDPVADRRRDPVAGPRGDEPVAVERDADGLARRVHGQHEDRALVGAHHTNCLAVNTPRR